MENINKEILIKRITELAKDKGISVHTAFVESGAGKNFKSNLATANPSLGKITLIANYLNTTVEYLLGGTDIKEKPASIDADDKTVSEFGELMGSLSADERKELMNYARFLMQKRKE